MISETPTSHPGDMPDDRAIALVVSGDLDAFSVLYARYVNRIYNYIFFRTGSQADAEDLTSRVFHRALSHLPRYRNMGVPFSAWLYRIAHNLVANWHRDNSRRQEFSIDDSEPHLPHNEMPETELMRSQEVARLMDVIRTFPAERQQLLILKFVEGLSNLEVATIMNRSEGAIKSLYHRTLLQLRGQLAEHPEK